MVKRKVGMAAQREGWPELRMIRVSTTEGSHEARSGFTFPTSHMPTSDSTVCPLRLRTQKGRQAAHKSAWPLTLRAHPAPG